MERDELKRLCGIHNSARIYSQLQRDYAKVCNCHPPPPQPMMSHPCVIIRDANGKYKFYKPHGHLNSQDTCPCSKRNGL